MAAILQDYRFWLNVFKDLAVWQDDREAPATSNANADERL
jgi:hypothetical protein